MGEELTGNLKRPTQPIKGSPDTAGAGNRPGSPAGNPSTANPGTGSPATAGGTGSPAGAGTGKAEKEKVSGLANVKPLPADAPPIPGEPKKKQQRKPRKKKENTSSFNAEQITALIVSISAITASRPGLEMFAISEVEAQQIATPLCNIIAKSERLNGLSEHADGLALVSACVVIMIPRLLLFFDAQKKKKLAGNGGVKLVRTDKKAESAGNDRKPVERPAAEQPIVTNSAFAAIPSII